MAICQHNGPPASPSTFHFSLGVRPPCPAAAYARFPPLRHACAPHHRLYLSSVGIVATPLHRIGPCFLVLLCAPCAMLLLCVGSCFPMHTMP